MPSAAPAKPGSSKKKKKPRTVLDLAVQRLYSSQEWLSRLSKQLGPHGDEHEEIALEIAREKAGLAYQAMVDLSRALPALKQAGWKPASTTIAVGDLVQVKPKRLRRFVEGGAFTALQVARLHVASVHGKYAKLTTSDGEPVGLYPLSYFKLAPAAIAK